jgi:hypothetical protein
MEAADSGMLLVHSPFGTLRTAEVSPLLFRDLTTCEDILFQADSATGRITHAILGVAPMMAMERVPLLMSPRLHQIILGGSIIVFAALVIAALARIVRRAPDDGPTPVRRGRRVLTTIAIANLLFVVLLVVLASDSHALFDAGGSGTARRVLQMALALPVLSLLLSVVAVFAAVVRWNRKIGTLGSRIGFSAAVAVALVFLWSLERWNLLGWRM